MYYVPESTQNLGTSTLLKETKLPMLFKPRSLKEKVKEIVSGFWKSEFTFLLFIGTYVWKLIKFVNDKIIRLFIHNLLIYIYI